MVTGVYVRMFHPSCNLLKQTLTIVAQGGQVVRDEGTGGAQDRLFADSATEMVPSVPPHLRGERQPIVERRHCRKE